MLLDAFSIKSQTSSLPSKKSCQSKTYHSFFYLLQPSNSTTKTLMSHPSATPAQITPIHHKINTSTNPHQAKLSQRPTIVFNPKRPVQIKTGLFFVNFESSHHPRHHHSSFAKCQQPTAQTSLAKDKGLSFSCQNSTLAHFPYLSN